MTVTVTTDGKHIAVPYRRDLASVIPHARRMTFQGQDLLVFPNASDEARVARNLGVAIPPPVITQYDWGKHRRPAWEVQKITAAMLVESARAYVLSTMGTGKSASVLFAIDYLRDRLKGPVLVTAPLSTLVPVWQAEIFAMFPKWKTVILHGSKEKRIKRLAEAADVFIINHHGVNVILDELKARGFSVVVIDELAVLRNKSSQLWKATNELVANPTVERAWGLTGSPTPNEPCDAWAQVRLLTPERTTRTMASFRDMTMRKVSQFRWIARREANDIVLEAMQPSVRYTRQDVMELPETTYVTRSVKIEGEALRAYTMLKDRMRVILADQSVTAHNEGVLQMKLLQVALGYIYDDQHQVIEIPGSGRLAALDEVIHETSEKIIVFAPFVHALGGITNHLLKRGHAVATIHGGVPTKVRDGIFTSFQKDGGPRIIVAHPQTMAHGLTLTNADTIVWFGPTLSLETYEQANARITRPGQRNRTFIVHLSGTPVEALAYRRLAQKGRMQGLLLQLFKEQDLLI